MTGEQTPAQTYSERRQPLADQQRSSDRSTRNLRLAFASLATVSICLGIASHRSDLPVWAATLPIAAALALLPRYLRLRSLSHRIFRLVTFYDRGLRRTLDSAEDSAETASAATGERFREPGHLFDRDLDILGSNSLFELLCTVRTELGQSSLADTLLHPANTLADILSRQQAVQELAPNLDLREHLVLLGSSAIQQVSGDRLEAWIDDPPTHFPGYVRPLLTLTTSLLLLGLLAGTFHLLSWPTLLPNLAGLLAVQGAVALQVRSRVLPILERVGSLSAQTALLRDGVALLAGSPFTSARIAGLRTQVSGSPAAADGLGRLNVLFSLVDQRPKEWYYLVALALCVGTQTSIAIEQWRRENASAMRLWLRAFGEFDALNALALYAFEHPENSFPEILAEGSGQGAVFEASSLAHPLLPRATAVRNDIALNALTRLLLISGSNMAGKSTLLRTVGTAAVLAFAGAPIPATSARLSTLQVCASIALTDSLSSGKSKFFAEVERLGAVLSAARSGTVPVLFLIDEIFSGTNSLDRQTAAAGILRALIAAGAIGALSTHDLALTEILDDSTLNGSNVHMASPDPTDPLAFDFRLKPGINTGSSASAILHLLGL